MVRRAIDNQDQTGKQQHETGKAVHKLSAMLRNG